MRRFRGAAVADPTTQNYTKKEIAAVLLAEDDLSDQKIADRIGITRKTLSNWKHIPEFSALVTDNANQIQAAMMRRVIAKRHRRLAVLDDLHEKSLRVIGERAEEYQRLGNNPAELEDDVSGITRTVPAGGETGLLVRQLRQVGTGHDAKLVEEFSVDVGLMREIRALHEQAAKELGQWTEKVNLSGGLKREYVIVTEDAL
jgi:hypothetical protein